MAHYVDGMITKFSLVASKLFYGVLDHRIYLTLSILGSNSPSLTDRLTLFMQANQSPLARETPYFFYTPREISPWFL